MSRQYRQGGFTLIEVLVALGIFMVLGVMSYRALSSIIESRDRVTQEQQRWQAITRFMQRLEIDLQQVPLDLPDALTYDPVDQILRLVRLSPNSVGDEVRTVRYRWRDGVIARDEQKMLAPAVAKVPDPMSEAEVVLSAVQGLEWFWSAQNPNPGVEMQWQSPPSTAGSSPPPALRVRLKINEVSGDVFRVIALR